ncbi:hypothetical protein FHX42_003546 [Saccharopolyspora lacisalsi]|uniref:S-adenosyl methyltransferase n=1 Tax=Halosaccharopolyspora lacisalsi TaxID=1000566 RepID=A0A839DZ90_9PSEU|nr:SAM-dependent methyltransferase [Halosaccharopolyspora lacisalsi]MBA8826170.1 hypothetical protein [Halosaccharopolyspora lacisalsi]
MSEPGPEPSEVDLTTPNIARMYDYFLGGAANFAVDRDAAEEFLRVHPGIRTWSRINRALLGRAVRELCHLGIDQFLDLGSGVPTVGNVHDIAHQHDPDARIAYVDVESVAVHHARHLIGDDPRITVSQADLRQPHSVLNASGVAGLLDFTRPVAVLTVAILDIIDTPDAAGLMSTYRDVCTPGSALVISNSAALRMTAEEKHGAETVTGRTSTPHVHWRTRQEVAEIFSGYELMEPGIVPSAQWRPDEPVSDDEALDSNAYAGVGLLVQPEQR